VFALSGAARLLTLPLLWRVPATVVKVTTLYTRTVAVRPAGGTVDQPVLASMEDAQDHSKRSAEQTADVRTDTEEAADETQTRAAA
jgi:hypothetical protein